MSVQQTIFGTIKDGRIAHLYTLTNSRGHKAVLSDFGAVWISMFVPDRNGILRDVVLGYDELEKYEQNFDMLGATVGRCVNRTESGRFTLDAKTYQLEINENGNNIHSSMENGFHKRLWEAHSYTDDSITFTYMSPDGECGYPGNLQVSLTYTLTSSGSLILSYEAISDQTTLLNITNHAYFNLGGTGSDDLLNTLVQINADAYTPVCAGTIPTGEMRPVTGTAFDFRKEKPIGQDIFTEDEQLQIVNGGYDHNFMICGANCGVRKAASAYLPRTGIRMKVYHDLPGLQFYTSNTTRDIIGKEGTLITRRSGFCMESHYPANAINTPGFPKPILTADTLYRTTTIYAFETE